MIFYETINFYSFFSSFHFWKWHSLLVFTFMVIEENYVSSRKTPCYIIWYLKRNQLIFSETIFIVCLLFLGGTDTSQIPLITIFIVTLFGTFIHLTRFHYISIFNRFIPLVRVMLLNTFLNLHAWLILIHALVSNLLVAT